MSEVTLDHHLHSFGEGDVEAILEDYTEESTIILPNAIIKGLDQIRDLFVNRTTESLPPGGDFHLHEKVVEENIGYLIWHAESIDHINRKPISRLRNSQECCLYAQQFDFVWQIF